MVSWCIECQSGTGIMHIVVLNRCYPPEVGATGRVIRDLARVWARHHRVTVLTGRPSDGPERHPYYLLRREREGDVFVERVGSTAFPRRHMAGRLADYLTYMVLAFVRCLFLRPKPDVVVAMTDPPLASLVGVLIGKIRRARYVYNIRDLHPDMAVAAGIVPPGWFVRLWESVHRWTLRQADRVVVLGEDMRDRVVAKGVDPERVAVVRDGAPKMGPPPDGDSHPVVGALRDGSSFVVMYAGNIGWAGAWDSLLVALMRCREPDLRFVFVGDGSMRPWVERRINGQPNVRMFPYFPEADLPYVLSAADLHVVTLRHGLEGLVIPSKVYSILMVGRPILAVVPAASEVARIVREHQCGIVVDPGDPEAIRQAILWARDHQDALRQMGERARRVGDRFDRAVLAEQLLREVTG